MRLGLSTYSFPWSVGIREFLPATPLNALDLLRFASQQEIGVLQFGDNYPLHLLSKDQLLEIKNLAATLHIDLQVGARKLAIEHILQYLDIATLLQSPFLRIVIDDDDFHPREDEVIAIVRELLPVLRKVRIKLAIENHDRFPSVSLRRIIKATDSDCVGICLDTANSLGAGEGVHEVVEALAGYTLNLHIKDFSIRRVDHKMGFHVRGCAAGSGMLNIPELINNIKPYGLCDSAVLELWSDPQGTIEETIAAEQSAVHSSIQYLKTILS